MNAVQAHFIHSVMSENLNVYPRDIVQSAHLAHSTACKYLNSQQIVAVDLRLSNLLEVDTLHCGLL